MSTNKRVREPVQVYLDRTDRELLEELVVQTGLSRAELLRRGLRSLADKLMDATDRGAGLERLIGALGNDPDLPCDLAERHDDYLYGTGIR